MGRGRGRADYGALSRLTRRADSVAADAADLVAAALRDVRGEIATLSSELRLASSADDRARAERAVRARIARLEGRLSRLLDAQLDLAARSAADAASRMTGAEVRYSKRRAEAVVETVTPAQGESLAAVFTDRMAQGVVGALREATVAVLRGQAVSGGPLKGMADEMRERWTRAVGEKARFVDAAGREWDAAAYFQMSVRTNTMRVYNDCLVDDIARATGSDLVRVSTGGSDPHCACAAWEGAILSVSGRTKGFPTYEQARRGGCFHPNCVHTLEPVDEFADADEIALQASVPAAEGEAAADPDAQDERKYETDRRRKMRDGGLSGAEATLAVDRDNLAASVRAGLLREDAASLVAELSDAQVAALVRDGNPPRFEPVKRVRGGTRESPKFEPERWRRGSRGGVVHVSRDATAADVVRVCKIGDGEDGKKPTAQNVLLVPDFKTSEEAEKFIGEKFGVTAIGMKMFDAVQRRGIAEAVRDAFSSGCSKDYLRYVSTGQAMRDDPNAKMEFHNARAAARPDDLWALARYRLKGINHGLHGEDAEWYGLCQDLRATGKTVAKCVSFGSHPILSRFNGIYFNAKAATETDGARCVKSGWWVPGAETVKGTMAHELGHAIDKSLSVNGLRLCEQDELRKLYRSMSPDELSKGLSRYGATKATEMVAEAWCEYTCSPAPRPLAKQIGDLIQYKAKETKSHAASA